MFLFSCCSCAWNIILLLILIAVVILVAIGLGVYFGVFHDPDPQAQSSMIKMIHDSIKVPLDNHH